eukprot:SAG31_NODE_1413_length_8459_cov_7.720215_6_plen_202_part_00
MNDLRAQRISAAAGVTAALKAVAAAAAFRDEARDELAEAETRRKEAEISTAMALRSFSGTNVGLDNDGAVGQQVMTVATPKSCGTAGDATTLRFSKLTGHAQACCAGLLERNWVAIDGFLGSERMAAVRAEIVRLDETGTLQPGELGGGQVNFRCINIGALLVIQKCSCTAHEPWNFLGVFCCSWTCKTTPWQRVRRRVRL